MGACGRLVKKKRRLSQCALASGCLIEVNCLFYELAAVNCKFGCKFGHQSVNAFPGPGANRNKTKTKQNKNKKHICGRSFSTVRGAAPYSLKRVRDREKEKDIIILLCFCHGEYSVQAPSVLSEAGANWRPLHQARWKGHYVQAPSGLSKECKTRRPMHEAWWKNHSVQAPSWLSKETTPRWPL